MGEEQLFSLVGSLGFPIVVAGYLMIKMDKTLQALTQTINDFALTNREIINKLAEKGDE